MINILIIEDEALIADHLSACLKDEGYNVCEIKDSVEEGLTVLAQKTIDLVLLDINLNGDLDGVDLANQINTKYKIPFIYLTSNTDGKTLARVKLTNPAGFIVKPFQADDLKPAIELALYAYNNRLNQKQHNLDSFFLKEKNELLKVNYEDISFAEAADNYTFLHTKDKRFILSQTLKKVEEKLIKKGFFRVHRSYLVNVSKIDCIRPTELTIGDKTIPISNTSKQGLLEFVQLF